MNWNQGAEQFLNALSSDNPTPGGGAAAAMAGAMGCALSLMSIGTTLKQKNTSMQCRASLAAAQQELFTLHAELKKLIQQDAQAYDSYMIARRLPTQDPSREQAIQDALWYAATIPVEVATACSKILKKTVEIEPLIASIILSDIYCAKHLLKSSITCCLENIRINMNGITDSSKLAKLQEQLSSFERLIKYDPSSL